MSDGTQTILNLLSRNPRGLTIPRIRRLCPQLRPAQVTKSLQSLRDQDLVVIQRGGRWQARNGTVSRCSLGVLTSPATPPAGGTYEPASDTRQHQTGTRWDTFRRLCIYYAECARLEERPSVYAGADQEGTRFLNIERPLDWHALGLGRPVQLIGDPDQRAFVQQLRRTRAGSRLFLGTPIDIRMHNDRDTGQKTALINPVFMVQVELRPTDTGIELAPQLMVDVNHGWLDLRFKKRHEDQLAFQELVGLREDDQSEAEDRSRQGLANVADAVGALWRSYRDWWQEGADLRRPDTTPALSEIKKDGLYNRVVLMGAPKLRYHQGLIRELQEIAKAPDDRLDQTALRVLFDHEQPPTDEIVQPAEVEGDGLVGASEFSLLNDEQRRACYCGAKSALTVITGPPGTGKSLVVSHLMAHAALQGQTALFASRNHQALEAVEPRLNALAEPEHLVIRPTRPFGDPQAQRGWVQLLTELLTKMQPAGASELFKQSIGDLAELLSERRDIESLVEEQLELREELARADRAAEQSLKLVSEGLAKRLRESPALQPESVFRHVADRLVPAEVNGSLWLRLCCRLSGWLHRRRLLQTACQLDSGSADLLGWEPFLKGTADRLTPERAAEALRAWCRAALAADAVRTARAIESRLQACRELNTLMSELADLQPRIQADTQEALKRLGSAAGSGLTQTDRTAFANIAGALRNNADTVNPERISSRLSHELKRRFDALIQHFPLWAVSNLSAGSSLPLTPACFDLLVVDEASQCDIGSVIPLLFRARRSVVVGDPKQLPPVFRMSRSADKLVRSRLDLADDVRWGRHIHRVNSFYAFADSAPGFDPQANLVRLENHYRCHPSIAGYCNTTFYGSNLRVRTDVDGLVAPRRNGRLMQGCVWTDVRGDVVRAHQGCYCPEQIDAILEELQRLRDDGYRGSVGVVTPFVEQKKRIADRARSAFDGALLDSWRFIADTADGFQGDERDIILFSLVGADNMPPGSVWFYRSNENRFNVAVSRARALLHIFGDHGWTERCGIPYIRQLAVTAETGEPDRSRTVRTELIGPVWEPALADAMRDVGLAFEQQHPTCGYYLDFALFTEGRDRPLNVEVDGETYHRDASGRLRCEDRYRDMLLRAAGWDVLRFWVYELREDMEACVERIRKELNKR